MKFEIGQKVFGVRHGNGTVIDAGFSGSHSIVVEFGGIRNTYTGAGKLVCSDKYPTLFHSPEDCIEYVKDLDKLTFKKIKEQCESGKHLLENNNDQQRLYIGFNRDGVLVTDCDYGGGSRNWSESEVKDWTIKPYNK